MSGINEIKKESAEAIPDMIVYAEWLLYPQYDLAGKVKEWMESCIPWAKKQAHGKLAREGDTACDSVLKHWEELTAMEVPESNEIKV